MRSNLADRGHAGQSLFRSVSGRCRVFTVDPCTTGPGDPATCGSGARRSGPVPGRLAGIAVVVLAAIAVTLLLFARQAVRRIARGIRRY